MVFSTARRGLDKRRWISTCLLLLGLVPATALATDGDWEAYKGWEISSLTIDGLDEDEANALKNGLAAGLKEGILGTKRPTFYPHTLDEDLKRCALFLAQRGFPYATITTELSPDFKRSRVGILLTIERGPPVRIADVVIDGVPPGLVTPAADAIGMEEGAVFTDAELQRSIQSVDQLLNDAGYARATVAPQIEWRDTTHVAVRFAIEPGVVYYFGAVHITGASDDLIPLIRKSVTVRGGEQFRPKYIEDSRRNLRVLDLFRQIQLEIGESSADTLDLLVDVIVREPRTFEFAVRWWTDEHLHGGVLWMHRNLFQRGRGGSIYTNGSEFKQEAKVSGWWPAILWARSRGVVTVGVERQNEEAYELLSGGVELSLRHYLSIQTTVRGGVEISQVDIRQKATFDDSLDIQSGLLTSFSFWWERNARDDWISPLSGNYATVRFEWAPDKVSDNSFLRVEPSVAVYWPLWRETTFANRLTVGLARPIASSEDIIPNKRFYSGGGSSMRGFNRRKLGPKDDSGAPLGGEAKFEASAELRFPIVWRFRGAVFGDAGQVWADFRHVKASEIELAVGGGLWLKTVIGPLRTDVAYRVTDFDVTQPRWVFHFSIGPAF